MGMKFIYATKLIEIDEKTICGEVAYIRWRAPNAKLATDTIIVRNGKIVAQTFAAYF